MNTEKHISSTEPSTELCLVMPAYNEEGCIKEVVEDWLSLLEQVKASSFRMIVVNDGSKDSTGGILDELSKNSSNLEIVHQSNAGHGAALLQAYNKALEYNPAWVFHVDSDDQFVSSDFLRLWERREESNFILGKRENRKDDFHRIVISTVMRYLNLILYGAYVADANVPFRLMRGSYLARLLKVLPSDVFAPNIFLSILARRDGQDVMAIPVQHRQRETGTVSIIRWGLIKACLRSAGELLGFRLSLKHRLAKLKAE